MFGSFIAVLDSGEHITGDGDSFADIADFKRKVSRALGFCKHRVRRFFYAYGREAQEYTPADFLEVFFGE